MNKPVKIRLHGALGRRVGKKEWDLHVSSVNEALYAININTDYKLKKILYKQSKKNIKYIIKVNDKILSPQPLVNAEYSPLKVEYKSLESIDVVPVVEGAFLAGLISMTIGFAMFMFDSPILTLIGYTLISYGLSEVLSRPPDRPEDRQITNPSSDPQALANSYLYNGPVNIINEGGPVPLGYGRLIVGSQVIMATYDIEKLMTEDAGRVI